MRTILGLCRSTMRFDTRITRWGGALMRLALRSDVGLVFFTSGLVKPGDGENTVFLFTEEKATP